MSPQLCLPAAARLSVLQLRLQLRSPGSPRLERILCIMVPQTKRRRREKLRRRAHLQPCHSLDQRRNALLQARHIQRGIGLGGLVFTLHSGNDCTQRRPAHESHDRAASCSGQG